jgi:Domain of unknown function (DUF5979)
MLRLRTALAMCASTFVAFGACVIISAPQAGAQTTNSALTISLGTKGPVPSSITGYSVTTTCTTLQNSLPSLAVTSNFGSSGGAASQNFSLTGASKCGFKVVATGIGARAALVVISTGSTVRVTNGFNADQVFQTTDTQAIETIAATAFTISIVFPSFTVKKVIFGDELFPGTDYEMAAACLYESGNSAGGTTFKLKGGASKTISQTEIPGLISGAICHVAEINNGGAASTSFSTTKSDGTESPGIALGTDPASFNPFTGANLCPVRFADGVCRTGFGYASAGAVADGSTITVTNGFVGDLIISKVVSGDPKSNIGLYEVKLSCTNSANRGPNETFLMKDRQTKVFTGILTGSVCTVTESRSDGAISTLSDNSGESVIDGKVVIKATTSGCVDPRFSVYPDCRANVIITNTYAATAATATTTVAVTTVAPAAAPTTAAPIAAAPVEEPTELDESEETVG